MSHPTGMQIPPMSIHPFGQPPPPLPPLTVTFAEALAETAPPLTSVPEPVTVNGAVPFVALGEAFSVKVDEAPTGMAALLNLPDTPAGRPDTVRVTTPSGPCSSSVATL